MPYRVNAALERAQALHAHIEATLVRLGKMGLNPTLHEQVAKTRGALDRGDLELVEAFLFLQRLANELDRLPTELPPLAGGISTNTQRALPGHITDLQVAANLAVFRCDGHPMVHEILDEDGVQMHTSVRRGIPFMRASVRDALRVEGSSDALVAEVTAPLFRLGRITRTTLSIHAGLATIGWRHDIEDETTHLLAIECLIALRSVRSPIGT